MHATCAYTAYTAAYLRFCLHFCQSLQTSPVCVMLAIVSFAQDLHEFRAFFRELPANHEVLDAVGQRLFEARAHFDDALPAEVPFAVNANAEVIGPVLKKQIQTLLAGHPRAITQDHFRMGVYMFGTGDECTRIL